MAAALAGETELSAVPGDDARPLLAIVGAGIGGLALANAAQRWGARVQVFERDADFDARAQGYGLTMQQGGSALRALGIAEDLAAEGLSASLHVSFSCDGTVLGRYGRDARAEAGAKLDSGGGRSARRNFLIPRQRLRQHLLDALAPGAAVVRWGCTFDSYSVPEPEPEPESAAGARPEAGVLLQFAASRQRPDGIPTATAATPASHAPVRAAVLVGADGIFSRVARQRLSAEHAALEYSGVLVMLGIAALEKEGLATHELLAKCNTVTETVDGTARLYTMPFSRTHHMWQLSVPLPLEQAQALHKAGPQALLAEARRLCSGWHAPLPALLQATAAADVTGYPVFDRTPLPPSALRPERPDSERRQEDQAVTLLGDALHPMAPFKGQGANTALLDGVRLGNELEHSAFGVATRAAIAAMAQRNEAAVANATPAAAPVPAVASSSPLRSTEEALACFERECLRHSAVKVETSRTATHKLHGASSHDFMKARQDPCTSTARDSWREGTAEQDDLNYPGGQVVLGKRGVAAASSKRRAKKQTQKHNAAAFGVGSLFVGQRVQVLSKNKTSVYNGKVTDAPLPGAPDEWGVKAVRPDTGEVGATAVVKWVHCSRCKAAEAAASGALPGPCAHIAVLK
jgi:salicylate hydroxylase